MSFEEAVLLEVLRAVNDVKLDAVIIGNAAAALHGVPITTQDIDLYIRDTPRNAKKIDQLVAALGEHVVASRPFYRTCWMRIAFRMVEAPLLVSRIATLTDRELEVMPLLAAGEPTKVVAKRFGIAQKTVDNHRAKILEKIGVDNPTQLARLVAKHD